MHGNSNNFGLSPFKQLQTSRSLLCWLELWSKRTGSNFNYGSLIKMFICHIICTYSLFSFHNIVFFDKIILTLLYFVGLAFSILCWLFNTHMKWYGAPFFIFHCCVVEWSILKMGLRFGSPPFFFCNGDQTYFSLNLSNLGCPHISLQRCWNYG